MPEPALPSTHVLDAAGAGDYLGLTAESVVSLARAGFLDPMAGSPASPEGLRFRMVDIKAFLARNADSGGGRLLEAGEASADPQDLLEALDRRADEMARRAFEIFASAFPEADKWSLREQAQFVEQSKARFEAILAVTSQGAALDDAIGTELEAVGATAAAGGAPLPQLLVILRISRDLVVQTAVELAEERGRHWGLALSLLLTRVLPAIDRLTDTLARGYWNELMVHEEQARARYEHVVEESSEGIYEIDLDGRIRYANAALAIIVGRQLPSLDGELLTDAVRPVRPEDAAMLLSEPPEGSLRAEVETVRADGVRRVLDVRVLARRAEDEVVGYHGVVRDVTAARDLDAARAEFLELVTDELRHPLGTVMGLGATLESHAAELPADRIAAMARSIRHQAERITRLADDLHAIGELQGESLVLSPRAVDLAGVTSAALASVGGSDWVERRVPPGVVVHADPRRLEQALANVVEFAVANGEPPVVVEVGAPADEATVHLVVAADGASIDDAAVALALARGVALRDRSGVALARALVEAMGGRIWFDADARRSAFHLTIPLPRRRATA